MLKTWYFPIQHFGRQSISPPPPQMNVSNYALNHFLVWSSAKESLRSAKNVVFFLFCILVGRPMGGVIASPPRPPPWLRYWSCRNCILKKIDCILKNNGSWFIGDKNFPKKSPWLFPTFPWLFCWIPWLSLTLPDFPWPSRKRYVFPWFSLIV